MANELELNNLARVRDLVERSENPHPSVIILIVVGSILIIYCMYICMVKKSATGEWVNEDNNVFTIKHNKWTDNLVINTSIGATYGVIKGNLIVIYFGRTMKMGVWLKDNIDWVDGTSWHCIYGY